MKNTNLHKSKVKKDDEYYTLYSDIQEELQHYAAYFKDKIVYCNCDDPKHSAFWKYFHLNFTRLGLRKLFCSFYSVDTKPYTLCYCGGDDENVLTEYNTTKTFLKGNGDFRSSECLDILKQADIVVTNPPFSLFIDYMSCVFNYNKDFLVIGNKNAVKYKEIFPYIASNKLWFGYNTPSKFKTKEGISVNVAGLCWWFTNLQNDTTTNILELKQNYNKDKYQHFDNIPELININKTNEIPIDYNGYMAVPITFLRYYSPKQFIIIDLLNRYTVLDYFSVNEKVRSQHSHCCNIAGIPTYSRVVIKKNKL